MKTRGLLALLLLALLAGAGCVSPELRGNLDTPDRHLENGWKFLEIRKYQDARREFERARDLNPRLSRPFTSLAVAAAGTGDFAAAVEALEQAERNSWLDGKGSEVAVGWMRVLTLGGDRIADDWLERTEDAFDRARRMGLDSVAPYYFMGLAYKEAFRLSDAGRMFAAVIQKGGSFRPRADAQYALVQRIRQADPRTEAGRRAALSDSLSRGQAAALLILELDGSRFLKQGATPSPAPPDAGGHPYEAEIAAVAGLGIHGLQAYPDGTFRPDEPVTRGSFAQILEDVLIRATGNPNLSREFLDNTSPFPDVARDSPWFNAVMVCATRGLMQSRDISAGRFAPTDPVSGPDAVASIQAIRRLLHP